MSKLVVTEFVTLDGVMEDPHLWSFPYWHEELGDFKWAELQASDIQLLGRVTYEGFAAAWPSRDGFFADQINSVPKHVASTTLAKAEWSNSQVIKGDVAEAVARLKAQPGKDILVHGSQKLVQYLRQHNLIDEYHLILYPIVLGSGLRLFPDGDKAPLQLLEAHTYPTGAMLLRYQPGEPAPKET